MAIDHARKPVHADPKIPRGSRDPIILVQSPERLDRSRAPSSPTKKVIDKVQPR